MIQQLIRRFIPNSEQVRDAAVRQRYGLNLLAVRRNGQVEPMPGPAHRFGPDERVILLGSDRDVQDALGLKVSQFVAIMGDAAPSREDQFMQQSEARERIRELVERLEREQEEGSI